MKPSIHPPPRVRKKKRGVGLAPETDLARPVTAISEGGINPATDWAARSAGAIYAENFNYADTTALRAAAAGISAPVDNVVLTTEHALSGKTLRINVLDSDQASDGAWVQYLNGVDATLYQRFYLQVVMWQNTWLDWPYHLADNSIGSPKFIIIDRWNGSSNIGEVVGSVQAMRGFVTAYRLTATLSQYSGMFKAVSTPANSSNWAWQPAIDKGTPNPVVTQNDWEQRYGPCYSGMSGDYTLGQPLTGVPDPDAAIGGVPFAKGDHTVVTFFVHYVAPNGFIRIWAGKRGDPPEWICDGVLTDEGSADIYPRDINGYNGFHLLPYVTERVAETGVRPNTYLDYSEVIVSANPINHPGGFPLPGEESPLALLAASLGQGGWGTLTIPTLTTAIYYGTGASTPTILDWAGRGNWDPIHRKAVWAGCTHTGGVYEADAGGTVWYDEFTNAMTRDIHNWNTLVQGHSYYHNALDPATGDLYRRHAEYGSTALPVLHRPYGSSVWNTTTVEPVPPDSGWAHQIAGGLAWVPQLNGGAGGLAFYDWRGFAYSSADLQTWTRVSAPANGAQDYHCVLVPANGCVYGGGGNGSTTLWKLSPTGVATQMASSPIPMGVSLSPDHGTLIAHPNGVDLLLIGNPIDSGGGANGLTSVYRYNAGSDTWTGNIGPHQIAENHYYGVSVPDGTFGVGTDGVVLFFSAAGGTGTPVCRVYKPT